LFEDYLVYKKQRR